MSLRLSIQPLIPNHKRQAKLLALRPPRSNFYRPPKLLTVKSLAGTPDPASPVKPVWEKMLSTAASLYPLYVTFGGAVACVKPSAFSWFVERGPASYSFSLGFIMLAMGLTLELREFFSLLRQRPFSILFGCVAQYTIMPAFGAIVSRALALPPSLSVGLILLACCPGGTASNVVTLIAQGDVPLSIVMTVCTTLAAVLLTPTLTKMLAGTYVPVDAVTLSISTLQVVVAPILLGSYMQSKFPAIVKVITPFAPLLAVSSSSLLASSVFSENVVRLKSSITDASNFGIQGIFSGDFGVAVLSVLLLHFAGFFVGSKRFCKHFPRTPVSLFLYSLLRMLHLQISVCNHLWFQRKAASSNFN
ncbi:sodium/pyruvate cotransporter BASS2, chloroplastic-like isoform X2 [Phoenix dactylifera]|uniref:Sodium/pyruvate cotransporter BASS2, chloroplastic-like isoform X2 n=1 Tax=Phoenix dactylifera TaxID=42345 RepID=A0A8B9AZ45_PHODC|nr:sodium/pyruvate cotransporter BASS2, chloroplastic-like isoform X2 [Phoenix dactylifera]